MRKNITLSMDDILLEKARTIASQQHTTINHLIRQYLHNYIRRNEVYEEAKLRIMERISSKPLSVGSRRWNRDEIHQR